MMNAGENKPMVQGLQHERIVSQPRISAAWGKRKGKNASRETESDMIVNPPQKTRSGDAKNGLKIAIKNR